MKTNITWATLILLAACGGTTPPPNEPSPDAKPTATAPENPTPSGDGGGSDLSEVEAALKANDFAKAKSAADAALAKNPKDAKALYYDAVASEGTGDKTNAEKRYRDALAISPGFADAAVNLTALLLDAGKNDDALAVIRPLAQKAGDDPLVQANYAAALSATGDHAGAAAAYAKAVAKGDAKPEIRLGYATELVQAGKKDDAAKVLNDGLARTDDRDVIAAYARALGQAGDYPDAIKAMDKAIGKKSSPDLLTYRALFKRSAKDLDGARADLEAAVKADAKFAHAYVYLGEIFEQQKKPADAKKAYENAVAAQPDGPAGKKAKEHLDAMKGKK